MVVMCSTTRNQDGRMVFSDTAPSEEDFRNREGKRALDGFGDISWLGNGDDALDLRLMVPASITPEVIQWFSSVDSSLREHGEGAWRELGEELMEETPLLSSLNLEEHESTAILRSLPNRSLVNQP